MHRAVIAVGMLLAAVGALLGALGNSPVVAALVIVAGALVVVTGLWLRRRTSRRRRADEANADDVGREASTLVAVPIEVPVAVSTEVPVAVPVAVPTGLWDNETLAPARPAAEPERVDRQSIREAELAREAELNAIAEGLRGLRSRELSATQIPEWKARIETWVDVELKARADQGEQVTQQAAEWMRDFGDIPTRDWRRHLLRHLRRLGYRNYQEGEW